MKHLLLKTEEFLLNQKEIARNLISLVFLPGHKQQDEILLAFAQVWRECFQLRVFPKGFSLIEDIEELREVAKQNSRARFHWNFGAKVLSKDSCQNIQAVIKLTYPSGYTV